MVVYAINTNNAIIIISKPIKPKSEEEMLLACQIIHPSSTQGVQAMHNIHKSDN